VAVKTSIFWNINPCIAFKIQRRLDDYVISIFSVKEKAKQNTSVEPGDKATRRQNSSKGSLFHSPFSFLCCFISLLMLSLQVALGLLSNQINK
jgi:hypothetical protein